MIKLDDRNVKWPSQPYENASQPFGQVDATLFLGKVPFISNGLLF